MVILIFLLLFSPNIYFVAASSLIPQILFLNIWMQIFKPQSSLRLKRVHNLRVILELPFP